MDPPFKVFSMQSEEGKNLFIEYRIDPEDPTTFLVVDGRRHFTASEATIHVIAASGGPWRMIHAVRIIPRSWRDAIYGVVARNRYQWFGRRSTCYLSG
jgi:predicted DCC family thiol-disulfide oxidoreductase YuxK